MVGVGVTAADGPIGHITRFLLGRRYWTVRYFVADTGPRCHHRELLISPMVILAHTPEIAISMRREPLLGTPPYDKNEPVTRRHEAAVLDYQGLPWYWAGPALWGPASTARAAGRGEVRSPTALAAVRSLLNDGEAVHLTDSDTVLQTDVIASDGPIGLIVDALIEIGTWRVQYLVADVSRWSRARYALLAPAWIIRQSWELRQLTSRVTRQAIDRAPRCQDVSAVTREHEIALHRYYGFSAYWQTQARD